MYFNKIEINNFGPFKKLNLDFKLKKINIIQGNNASGKTHIMAAVHFLFNNNNAVSIDKHVFTNAEVKVDLKIDNNSYVLKKRFINNKAEIVMSDLEKLTDFSNKFNKNNIHFISCETLANKEMITVNEVKKISEFFRTLNILEQTKKDIQKRIRLDDLKNKNPITLMSSGERVFVNLLIYLSRARSEEVYICDSIFPYMDYEMINYIGVIIDKLDISQIILLDCHSMENISFDNYSIQKLPNEGFVRNTLGYNYSYEFKDQSRDEGNNDELIKLTNYFLGNQLDEEECRFKEFKEVKGENPCSSIINVAEVYVVAFLNCNEINEGSIVWGISNDRKVIGVELDYEDRDKIRRDLSERFSKITPYVSPDAYKIDFKEIYDNENKVIEDKYIVEVKVKVGKSELLFATPKGEVYIKTEGGKKKLTTIDIQQEIKHRIASRT